MYIDLNGGPPIDPNYCIIGVHVNEYDDDRVLPPTYDGILGGIRVTDDVTIYAKDPDIFRRIAADMLHLADEMEEAPRVREWREATS